MKIIGDKFELFKVVGVKFGFNNYEENGELVFEDIIEILFLGKWKVIFFYLKDFIFVCLIEIVVFVKLNDDFVDCDMIVFGGLIDNEFVKFVWCCEYKDLNKLNQWLFVDFMGVLVDQFGVCEYEVGVVLCVIFIVDLDNVIQYVLVNNLNVGCNLDEVLCIFDGLQIDELCLCNCVVGGLML